MILSLQRVLLSIAAVIALVGNGLVGQSVAARADDLPNPFEMFSNWGSMPEGRTWGSTGAITIDRDGRSIWAIERCGSFSWQQSGRVSCAGSAVAPVLKFDAAGNVVRSFGGGMFIFPHGLYVDHEGNVWVTDARAATDAELAQFPDAKGKGHTVVKFSPEGKVLLTLGKAGVAGDPPEYLNEPCDVIVGPNGHVLVSEGHSGQNARFGSVPPNTVSRISEFSNDGKFIRAWGKLGSGPGEFMTPHALAFDSRGRLFVADRGNDRVQVFDPNGKFIEAWSQFGRPSDIYIDANDVIYVADSESGRRYHPGWSRGVRIARLVDAKVKYMIAPHKTDSPEGMSGEGVTVDRDGNVYSAEVGTDGGPLAVRGLTKYVPRSALFTASRPQDDAYTGLWRLNLPKTGGEERTQTLTIVVRENQEAYRSELVSADGRRQVTDYTANYDGTEYPSQTLITDRDGRTTKRDDRVILKKIDDRTRERHWKQDGRIVRILRRVVSADGRVLTSRVVDVDAGGNEKVTSTLVFDKQ
jgi:sugar lactone lactonase YvrE